MEPNYSSGDDYEIQFLHYRFSFNADDFEQRVTAAAVKLGLVADNELSGDETSASTALRCRCASPPRAAGPQRST